MRRLYTVLLLALLVIVFPHFIFAQVFPTLEQDPEWIIPVVGLGTVTEERFKLSGQTLSLQGKEWPIVQRITVEDFSGFLDTSVYNLGAYLLDDDRVYFNDFSSGLTGLLYDFCAEEGDTLDIVASSEVPLASIAVVVTNVIGADDENRPRVISLRVLEGPGTGVELRWKEGLGDIKYPFISTRCLDLNCDGDYVRNELILHGDTIVTNGNGSCITSSSHQETGERATFRVYPNPTTSEGVSFIPDGALLNGTKVEVTIINQLGQFVKKWEGYVREDVSERISLQGVMPGSYYIVFKEVNSYPIIQKLVVAN